MPKIIIFMRHGKADDPYHYKTDFERPLVKRGKEEVKLAAKKLQIVDIVPDTIISSPAQRTTETALAAASVLDFSPKMIQFDKELYGGNHKAYLQAAGNAAGTIILLIGHNPEIGQLSMHFSGDQIQSFPTSAMAAFRFADMHPKMDSDAEMLFFDLRK